MKKLSLIIVGLMFILGLIGSSLMGLVPGAIKIAVGFIVLIFGILFLLTVGYLVVCVIGNSIITSLGFKL